MPTLTLISRRVVARAAIALLSGMPFAASAQAPDAGVATAQAARTNDPIALDGRDADAVWRTAPISDEFFQFTPAEAGPARFRTAFQVAYDDRTLYVYVRAFDPSPDSLVALLSRRDIRTPSEWIKVVIDGFHDRRSAMQFMVNPAGVKRDASVYGDINEDGAWDGVWDVAVTVDSLGWAAEFAIPFSQLRFTPGSEQVFGFGIWRDDARHGERDAWPVYRPSRATFASQLGDLVGITDIGRNRRLEIMPYAVTKNVTEPTPSGFAHPQQQSVGLDFKAGLTSNITLDATINPDFGQVEADPAVLNLSAFEVRFDERRPFFQEGVNLFRCGGPCEGIFYTRRVGRTPQLRTAATDPLNSRIQAAAKVTGRFEGGAQFGVVAVSSAREVGSLGQTIEPQTSTFVGRLVQDFRGGRSQFGGMFTGVLRDLDNDTENFLRKEAYTFLLQGYHRFADRWEVSGYTGTSSVRGTEAAIRRTQLSSVHFHQRPDHDVRFDSTATTMNGGVNSITLRRYAGRVRYETTTRYAVPNTELNDLGFVVLINDMMVRNNLSIQALRPGSWYRRRSAFVFTENHWTTGGLPTGFTLQTGANAEFKNFWTASTNLTGSNLGATHCVSCARGGPALRQSSTRRLTANLGGDQRKPIIPGIFVAVSGGDGGRSWSREAELALGARVGTRTSFDLGLYAERRATDAQWVANYGATFSDTTHYTFARLDQNILGITTRANVTVSPTVSVQLYAQPFIASGRYSDWREVVDAHAKAYDDRFAAYGTGDPPGFNSKQFNSNVVFRWEYRPGSVLFVVWQQGRADFRNPGTFEAGRDLQNLFATNPNNTFLVKLSYWFNP